MKSAVLLAFIPVFVAVDVIGTLPIFVMLTEGIEKRIKNKIILQSLLTAVCLAVGFIFLGKWIFRMMGITMGDFMVAGGAILFALSITDLVTPGKEQRSSVKELGVVPLGTPLIVGPAVLTTSLIIINEYGLTATVIAVVLNILLAALVFWLSDFLIKVLGVGGARAMSKITALLLAAIAVMMIRKGVGYMGLSV